jgi:hypothetical protein
MHEIDISSNTYDAKSRPTYELRLHLLGCSNAPWCLRSSEAAVCCWQRGTSPLRLPSPDGYDLMELKSPMHFGQALRSRQLCISRRQRSSMSQWQRACVQQHRTCNAEARRLAAVRIWVGRGGTEEGKMVRGEEDRCRTLTTRLPHSTQATTSPPDGMGHAAHVVGTREARHISSRKEGSKGGGHCSGVGWQQSRRVKGAGTDQRGADGWGWWNFASQGWLARSAVPIGNAGMTGQMSTFHLHCNKQ